MDGLPTLEQAWRDTLYATSPATARVRGFYTKAWPAEHFTTATHLGTDVARALVALARGRGLSTVVDVGAGGGELVAAMHALDPGLRLVAVELRARPRALAATVGWQHEMPTRVDGLLIGHELLDNVPCPVFAVDAHRTPRAVHVDPATGVERLGDPPTADELHWLQRWWPEVLPPLGVEGMRAEVGSPRDDMWAGVVARLANGLAVAVDYGHLRDGRPPGGSLRGYARGRRVAPAYDGSRDVTADVALDAVAHRVGGSVHRQRDLLGHGALQDRPSSSGPAAESRLRDLARAGQRAEVRAAGGLGELGWVVTARGVRPVRSA